MVIRHGKAKQRAGQRAYLLIELFVAIGLLASVVLPLTYGQWFETNALRTAYQRAVAMELVDGELEVLLAGEWRQFGQGTHAYALHGAALTNLPPGHCTLTVQGDHLRLEWHPDKLRHGRGVVRETEAR